MFLQKIRPLIFFAVVLLASCGSGKDSPETDPTVRPDSVAPKPVITDTFILRLQTVLTDMQNKELAFENAKPTGLSVDDISYQYISEKEYYQQQHASLDSLMKRSSDKEKTGKALSFLEKKIKESGDKAELYKVQFHLKARVADIVYDEQKIVYLKKDLTQLRIVYPD